VTNGAAANGANGVTAKAVRSQYRFMELAREKAQSGPALPGAGGAYHVRTTPPSRSGTTPGTFATAAAAPAIPGSGVLPA
jgi:hypothetical protein